MKLYGKDALKARLDSLAEKGRLPHAVLFAGSAGSGRKALAKYAAELMMCPHGACGECPVCRNIENNTHPDLFFVKSLCGEKADKEKGGKYNMDDLRSILDSTAVRPNNGAVKIYVFEDCDTMLPVHQNALLKLIEEPAEYLRFIFTCENTGLVLETVLSRVTGFEVPDTPVAECERFLIDSGRSKASSKKAAQMFAGNIGICLDYLNNGSEAKIVESARSAAEALGKHKAYNFGAALSKQTDRREFRRVIEYLMRFLADALNIKAGCAAEFSDSSDAEEIAARYSESDIVKILDAAGEVLKNDVYNIGLPLTVAYFTSRVFGE